jgi:hypothetical protein
MVGVGVGGTMVGVGVGGTMVGVGVGIGVGVGVGVGVRLRRGRGRRGGSPTVTLESPAVPEKACWPSLTLVPTITPYLKDSTDTTVKVTSLLLSGSTLPLTTPFGSPLTLVADPSS